MGIYSVGAIFSLAPRFYRYNIYDRFGPTVFSIVVNAIFVLRIRALYDQSRKGTSRPPWSTRYYAYPHLVLYFLISIVSGKPCLKC